GYSWQQSKRETTGAGRTGLQYFNNAYYTTISSATGDASASGDIPMFYRIRGYLGRVNYSLMDKYLVTLTGRYDEDSRFGKDYRSGFFPSAALAWRISKENFFNVSWLNDLKLHASYGKMGIVTVGSWDYIGFLNSNPRAVFGPNQVPNVGATQGTLANSNLTWETRTIKNIGLDAALLNNRLSATFEVYDSFSKDALLNLPVAWYLGNLGGDPAVNAASIRNRGIEVSATVRNNEHDLKWDLSANLTTIKNKVEDVGNQGETAQGVSIDFIQTGISRSQVGRSIGEWYVRKTNGLFQSQAEVDNYKNSKGIVIQPLAKPGDIRYVDINDDGVINSLDRTFAGSPWPTLQTGAQFNASYKGFSLNVQLIGVFGFKILNGVRQVLDGYQNTNFRKGISPWAPGNTNTDDPRIGIAINDPGLAENGLIESSRWLENGSYVRIRNVEIGYALPRSMMESVNISSARLYISGQNLLTITDYSGLDPDVVGNGILERGYDNGNWPSSRIISLGIQCEF
ncbi:MAG TPA: SusC/RagA family TonB-linked outer membrane protein, partial [Prolixibacteraceae bacterium]|nr:SusC/RagA family TonB-linked outer membrane protein [Prolixibacteraceae bacterium]